MAGFAAIFAGAGLLVAVGTSPPELIASVMASFRQGDIAIGNILGSSIFNVPGVMGATALIRPMRAPVEILRFDIWAMLAATVLLLLFAGSGGRPDRWEGRAMLILYGAYAAALAVAAF